MKQEHLESKKTTKTSPKELVLQNMDAIVAVLALTVLALHLGGVLFQNPPGYDAALLGARQTAKAVEEALQNVSFDDEAAVARGRELSERIRSAWSPLEKAPPAVSPGVTYPRALVEAVIRGESNEIRFNKPRDVKSVAQRGLISVSWSEHEENNVRASEWIILRAEQEGEFREHARLPGVETKFEDRDVRPGVRYSYRIAGVTNDPLVQAQVPRTEESQPASAEGLADFRLTLEEADLQAGTATFLVEKWHENGWWPKRFTHKVGEAIGKLDAGSGVDYSTNRLLKALDRSDGSETSTRHEVVFDAEGKVLMEGGAPVTEEVVVTHVFDVVTARIEGGGLPPSTAVLEKR